MQAVLDDCVSCGLHQKCLRSQWDLKCYEVLDYFSDTVVSCDCLRADDAKEMAIGKVYHYRATKNHVQAQTRNMCAHVNISLLFRYWYVLWVMYVALTGLVKITHKLGDQSISLRYTWHNFFSVMAVFINAVASTRVDLSSHSGRGLDE